MKKVSSVIELIEFLGTTGQNFFNKKNPDIKDAEKITREIVDKEILLEGDALTQYVAKARIVIDVSSYAIDKFMEILNQNFEKSTDTTKTFIKEILQMLEHSDISKEFKEKIALFTIEKRIEMEKIEKQSSADMTKMGFGSLIIGALMCSGFALYGKHRPKTVGDFLNNLIK
jgi:hypothetical protein